MATTIKLKNSVTTTNTPSSLAQGEVAINITDKKVWVGNAATTPVQLLGDGGSATFLSITVTGVSTFSAGTVSAPSITTSGDTNTGIFFPAADTIAFTEGGVESMRIDSDGDVGIGTASPSYRLHVVTPATATRQTLSNISRTTANWVRFTNPEYSTDASMGLLLRVFPDADARQGAGILASGGDANGNTNLSLFVSSGTSSSTSFASYTTTVSGSDLIHTFNKAAGSEAMRIDSSGSLLINGTSSLGSNYLLQMVNSRASFAGNSDALGLYLRYNTSTAGAFIGSPSANALAFADSNGTERMRIDSSGNVVIANSTARVRLDVRSDAVIAAPTPLANAVASGVFAIGDTVGSVMGLQLNGSSYDTYIQARNMGASSTAYNLLLQPLGGNVGIGTTSPSFTFGSGLQVQRAGDSTVSIKNTTNSVTAELSAYSSGLLLYTTTGHPIIFGTGGSERMRMTNGGNFLVTTTADLTVAGVTADNSIRGVTGNGRWVTAFQNTGNSTPWGITVNYNNSAPNNTSQDFIYCYDSAAQRFGARSNGGIANYSGNNVNLSDEREKTNINLANSYLDKICAIPVKTFNYVDQNREEDDGLTLGVIAQDVQSVAPELIMESNWGTKDNPKMRLGIYQTDLQYALMKSIQELNAKVETQAAEIALLKSK